MRAKREHSSLFRSAAGLKNKRVNCKLITTIAKIQGIREQKNESQKTMKSATTIATPQKPKHTIAVWKKHHQNQHNSVVPSPRCSVSEFGDGERSPRLLLTSSFFFSSFLHCVRLFRSSLSTITVENMFDSLIDSRPGWTSYETRRPSRWRSSRRVSRRSNNRCNIEYNTYDMYR